MDLEREPDPKLFESLIRVLSKQFRRPAQQCHNYERHYGALRKNQELNKSGIQWGHNVSSV
jgi:hypothetical protein